MAHRVLWMSEWMNEDIYKLYVAKCHQQMLNEQRTMWHIDFNRKKQNEMKSESRIKSTHKTVCLMLVNVVF